MSTSPPRRAKKSPPSKSPETEPDATAHPPEWADANCRAVLEAAPDAMLVVDRAGEIVVANTQAEKLFGYGRKELIGRSVESLIPPRHRAEHPHHRGNFFGNPRVRPMGVGLELFALRGDGTEVPVEISLSPLTTESGTFVISAIRDLTERRRIEGNLKASEERSRWLVQGSSVAMIVSRRLEEKVELMNDKFTALFGYTIDDVPDVAHWWPLAYPDEAYRQAVRTEWQARVEKAIRNVTDIEPMAATVRCKDGSIRHIEAHLSCMGDTNLVTLIDLTGRKRAEEALRESEDKLRLLLDSTAEAIYGIDLEHRCTFCNPACLRALGYEQVDEMLGKNMHNLIHHSRADGTSFPVEECGVHRVTRTGEGVHAEDEMFWRANGTSFPAEYWSYPQRRGEEVVGAVVAFIDITERKLVETALADVSRKLLDAQEKERNRIGRELHDDVNQRLAMLAVELERLQDNPSEVRSRVQELRKQTTEISNAVQALSHELHSSKLEYLGAVRGMKSWCKEFGERQGLQIEFKSPDAQISLPQEIGGCLFRVLQEALHNAAKHSGVRRIEVQLREDSGEIHLVVSDLGRGFDLETTMQGRGLGLASMQERVRLVNGTIEIQSKPMGGTTIHVRVPLSSENASQRAAG